MRLKFFLFSLMIGIACVMRGQEREAGVGFNPEQAARYAAERDFAPRAERGGGSMSLPFFDDFSRYSLPTDNPEIPEEWQRWTDNSAFINCSYPLAPMTIGVATLDGLDETGYPYHAEQYYDGILSETNDGPCDTLTSLPIDLEDFVAEDSVFLLFHYEGGGLGDGPNAPALFGPTDSLRLEFYSTFGVGEWVRVWSVVGTDVTNEFDTVFIHINDPLFLRDGFRMRFVSYGTLTGSLDNWHIDYVLINDGIHPESFQYDEVAMEYCNNTLLSLEYTSMPWTHYLSDPGFFMADEMTYYQRNLGTTENISTAWKVEYNGTTQFTGNVDNNPTGNGFITRTVSLQDYQFGNVAPDSATFDVCIYASPTDAQPQNDTMCFQQSFKNYYAYDDGSAERSYLLEHAGSKAAMKFNAEIGDTLMGVYMYWMPMVYLADNQSFFLQVWNDQGGAPGGLMTSDLDNFNFLYPHYFTGGRDLFVYYPLQQPLFIDGTFYVGWSQQNEASLNIGLDKNTGANATKLFYQIGGSSAWNHTAVLGSVMMRPVFKSGMPDWVRVEEQALTITGLYPNPASGEINITLQADLHKYDISIVDIAGRTVMTQRDVNGGMLTLDISHLENASYLIRITDADTGASAVEHFIKN